MGWDSFICLPHSSLSACFVYQERRLRVVVIHTHDMSIPCSQAPNGTAIPSFQLTNRLVGHIPTHSFSAKRRRFCVVSEFKGQQTLLVR